MCLVFQCPSFATLRCVFALVLSALFSGAAARAEPPLGEDQEASGLWITLPEGISPMTRRDGERCTNPSVSLTVAEASTPAEKLISPHSAVLSEKGVDSHCAVRRR